DLPLTRTQRVIVSELIRARGNPVSGDQLAMALFGTTAGVSASLWRVHVRNIRAKGEPIATYRGEGYGFGERPKKPSSAPCPKCGTAFEPRTTRFQETPWTACPAHRGERYQQAARELEEWRAANRRTA